MHGKAGVTASKVIMTEMMGMRDYPEGTQETWVRDTRKGREKKEREEFMVAPLGTGKHIPVFPLTKRQLWQLHLWDIYFWDLIFPTVHTSCIKSVLMRQ